jgi:hypothetical protein
MALAHALVSWLESLPGVPGRTGKAVIDIKQKERDENVPDGNDPTLCK